MVDTRLPLQAATPIDTATPIQNMNAQQNQNALTAQELLKQHYATFNEREKSRLASTVAGAVQLKSFLDAGDMEGASNFLQQRRSQLQQRIAAGENIDTQETDYAIGLLRSGKVDQLTNDVKGLISAGQVYGLLDGTDTPSNVKEWQYYNSLSPQQQEQYLTMKRANSVVNLGGTQMVPSQSNPAGPPKASYDVTPKPEDMPDFKRQQAQAAAEGTAAGEATATANTTITRSGGLLAAFDLLKESAKAAPSGAIEGGIASASNTLGYGGKGATAQGDFSVKRAAAENAIREAFRVAGSGANSDRDALPFIQMLPSENDSTDVKLAKIDAAMQAVKVKVSSLAQQRGIADPFGGTSVTSNKVRMFERSTGKVYDVDAADVPAAEAEGLVKQ